MRFDGYAEQLGLDDASVMMPDIGATLYYSDLGVIDLAGLADKTVARAMTADNDAFHDYVFDEVQPTFILTHSVFTQMARFDEDARFRQDYATICEEPYDGPDAATGPTLYSGAFVRRDAISGPGGAQWLASARGDCGDLGFAAGTR
jgi:hypothetical protein